MHTSWLNVFLLAVIVSADSCVYPECITAPSLGGHGLPLTTTAPPSITTTHPCWASTVSVVPGPDPNYYHVAKYDCDDNLITDYYTEVSSTTPPPAPVTTTPPGPAKTSATTSRTTTTQPQQQASTTPEAPQPASTTSAVAPTTTATTAATATSASALSISNSILVLSTTTDPTADQQTTSSSTIAAASTQTNVVVPVHHGLSTAAIGAIAGVGSALVIIVIVIFFFWRRKKSQNVFDGEEQWPAVDTGVYYAGDDERRREAKSVEESDAGYGTGHVLEHEPEMQENTQQEVAYETEVEGGACDGDAVDSVPHAGDAEGEAERYEERAAEEFYPEISGAQPQPLSPQRWD